MLQEGDVIEIKEGYRVYAEVPEHFAYSNKRGCWDLTQTDIVVGGDFDYFAGKYIVVKTNMEGGGSGHNDTYPDGHRVFCVDIEDKSKKLNFYQSGCFTAMIENIQPIAKAKLTWKL